MALLFQGSNVGVSKPCLKDRVDRLVATLVVANRLSICSMLEAMKVLEGTSLLQSFSHMVWDPFASQNPWLDIGFYVLQCRCMLLTPLTSHLQATSIQYLTHFSHCAFYVPTRIWDVHLCMNAQCSPSRHWAFVLHLGLFILHERPIPMFWPLGIHLFLNDESLPPTQFYRSRFHSVEHESHYSHISQILFEKTMNLDLDGVHASKYYPKLPYYPRGQDRFRQGKETSIATGDDEDEEQHIRHVEDATMH
ncbi:hypothetical protein VNO78_11687 [Psophocarpus tetragonolobus]|uniref:Uncharacterized protein n=1 Tax=Psophocarpus tetragonolobus TaxID=3891 RepID=A0AAN9XNV5_PSOTE